MAVPFLASNTPSPRAEFAQPDFVILLTSLSYLEDGLSAAEMKEAVEALLKLPPPPQENFYKRWSSNLAAADKAVHKDIDKPLKLDIKNATCVELLLQVFAPNRG